MTRTHSKKRLSDLVNGADDDRGEVDIWERAGGGCYCRHLQTMIFMIMIMIFMGFKLQSIFTHCFLFEMGLIWLFLYLDQVGPDNFKMRWLISSPSVPGPVARLQLLNYINCGNKAKDSPLNGIEMEKACSRQRKVAFIVSRLKWSHTLNRIQLTYCWHTPVCLF